MSFEELQETWTVLGEKDPLWAILTNDVYVDAQWDPQSFFASGGAEITFLLREIEGLGLALTHERALDFGCGVGRVTRALGEHFARVEGVDIAPTMLKMAAEYNADRTNLAFHLNQQPDLSLFDDRSFDFVYSCIVLQHMEPEFAKAYIQEFVRVLAPGGIAAFQVPAGASGTVPGPDLRSLVRPSIYFDAGIEILDAPRRFRPGDPHVLRVRIRNDSRTQWIADAGDGRGAGISLGNHWVTPEGHVVCIDDGRTQIFQSLRPGESTVVDLVVNAPIAPGRYGLELDMVEEHVAWFADKGSTPTTIDCKVERPAFRRALARVRAVVAPVRRPSPVAPPQATRDDRPGFEMHRISPEDVAAAVATAGGRLLAIQHDGSAGRDWQSYFYFVGR